MQRVKILSVLLLSFCLFSAATSRIASGAEYEQFADRKAADIVPGDVIKGNEYEIRETVKVFGYMDHFTVDSEYGVFEVTGDAALRKLVREITAMKALRKIETTSAFGEALAESATKPVRFAGHLVTDPVETVSDVSKGVGKLFSNAYSSITTETQAGEDSAAESLLSLSKYKREYAYHLDVDPYSSNAVFQEDLERVAWAAAAGNLSFSAATSAISGGVGIVISSTGFAQSVNEYLKDQPPSQIRLDAQEKLSSMGVAKEDVTTFLENDFFSPRHTAVIVANLDRMTNVNGRDVFIRYAGTASDEEQANFMMHIVQLMRGFHEKNRALKEITMNSGFVTAHAADGTLFIPFALDYVIWTERGATIFGNMADSPVGRKGAELWVTGTLSPLARENLETLKISAVEQAGRQMDFMD